MDVPAPPADDAATPPFVGHLDGLDDGALHGWAIDRDGAPCAVAVAVNGRAVDTILSDLPRPDLAAGGTSRGQGGWRLALGDALGDADNLIAVTLPDGSSLPGSPIRTAGRSSAFVRGAPPEVYRGSIDVATPPVLSGWAATADGRAATVTIEADGARHEVPATDPRPDLAAGGLTGGDGGWHFDVTAMLAAGATLIHVRLPDGSDFAGSPLRLGAPEPVEAPPPAPAPPVRAPDRPTLAELDEISLDDLALAVASGMIRVAPPPPPEPVTEAETPSHDAPPPLRARRKGFLARLLRR